MKSILLYMEMGYLLDKYYTRGMKLISVYIWDDNNGFLISGIGVTTIVYQNNVLSWAK